MLKLRFATAFVLASAVLAGVVFLPNDLFALFAFVLGAFGLYEWAGLAGLARPWARIIYVLLAGTCMAALWFRPEWWMPVLVATSVFWLFACGFVLQWAAGRFDRSGAALGAVTWDDIASGRVVSTSRTRRVGTADLVGLRRHPPIHGRVAGPGLDA